MARPKNPKREKAFSIFKEHDGSIMNRELAKILDVPEKTISAWKSRDKWNEKLGTKPKRSTAKKRSTTNSGPDPREKVINALVEAGTYSPALDLLIDLYVDAYEEYQEDKTEKLRKELARLLGQLGLDGKSRDLVKNYGARSKKESEEEKPKEEVPDNKLLMFRQRMTK
ncbi:phage terminase small subunit-related protein [Lederbergia sp. NSJ-179]|uniref:phage terminase small subunit-related protein n=1 Tax=Lederbergia sp. NSJ-179 TaxID=2931402 RepID=UPI001FD270BC|nr:phage terminase small subunit-related protein [Lederbergia sp. NSJ-179]MCJ7840518.1 phage terminase small subunit-related protein [Lederbergia sp. NSJ-179]